MHGVGGESAEDTLHEPHPMLVAGTRPPGSRGPDVAGRQRESYSWAGQPRLWLLLPFALANLAGRMD